jgi:hypothetical protein
LVINRVSRTGSGAPPRAELMRSSNDFITALAVALLMLTMVFGDVRFW